MNNYELLYILPASMTGEDIAKNFEDVKKNVEKLGGKMLITLLEHPFLTKAGISKEEESEEVKNIPVVKRKLAYSIKHEKFGFYCLVNFEAEGKKIKDIDEYLRLNNNVLRHIISQEDPMSEEELERLQTLFARKKAEQDKEEAESNKGKAAREEIKAGEKKTESEKEKEDIQKEIAAEEKVEPKKEEEKKEAIETKNEKKTESEKEKEDIQKEIAAEEKVEPKKEEEKKTASKKSKIKLEELEDKLDEILEDTIV
ncbi:MAG: 30S ribosomal protein S6 [Candidatus Pacebacteria bacterium]|nr:30S ribosomal protein S6 [Candidatus Paceibacterota bacterium]